MTHPTDSAIPGIPVTFLPYYIARAELFELVDQIEACIKASGTISVPGITVIDEPGAMSLMSKIGQLDHSLTSLHQEIQVLSKSADADEASERDTFLAFALVHEYKGLAMAASCLRQIVVGKLKDSSQASSITPNPRPEENQPKESA